MFAQLPACLSHDLLEYGSCVSLCSTRTTKSAVPCPAGVRLHLVRQNYHKQHVSGVGKVQGKHWKQVCDVRGLARQKR